jgi:hypothetical protein
LVHQDRSNFLKTSIGNIQLEGVWVPKVEVREQTLIVFFGSQTDLDIVTCTVFKVVYEACLVIKDVDSFKTDTVWEEGSEASDPAMLTLFQVDILEDAAL